MSNYARIGTFGILALVALRIGVGWHFYMEGATKVRDGGFSSEGFLGTAKGPLADNFNSLIWDHEGRFRLDQEKVEGYFRYAAAQTNEHFQLTDDQQKTLNVVLEQHLEKLQEIYASNYDAIYKYWQSVDRFKKMESDPMWNDVTSLRGQKESIQAEIKQDVRPAIASVDAVWKRYEAYLNSVANKEQLAANGFYRFARPGEGLMSSRYIDQIIPIFDMVVGILLIVGLLTPVASIAGAMFLIGVVLSQMPGYPGTQPTYYQAIEALALLTLAGTDAGRYAGLDFIPWSWWQRRRAAKLERRARRLATT